MTEPTRRTACNRPCAGLCRADGFAAVHREHRAWMIGRARAVLGDRESAEDAVQEAFLRAWRACAAFDPTGVPTLRAWLATITRNVVIDIVRARAIRPQLPPAGWEDGWGTDAGASGGSAVDPALENAPLRLLLLDALAGVSDEHRGAVLRAVLRDRSYPEVAAELGLPVGTVKSRVHYALRGLRGTLDPGAFAA